MIRSDALQNRHALLNAACALIGNTGSVDVSSRDIADSAGMSTATLYRHFDSKQHLIDEISVDRWTRAAVWASARTTQASPLQDIVTVLERFSSMVAADSRFIAAAGLEIGRTPYAIRPVRSVFDARFAELWVAAQGTGDIRSWATPRDVMQLMAAFKESTSQPRLLTMIVAGFSAPHVDAEQLVRIVRHQRQRRSVVRAHLN